MTVECVSDSLPFDNMDKVLSDLIVLGVRYFFKFYFVNVCLSFTDDLPFYLVVYKYKIYLTAFIYNGYAKMPHPMIDNKKNVIHREEPHLL